MIESLSSVFDLDNTWLVLNISIGKFARTNNTLFRSLALHEFEEF